MIKTIKKAFSNKKKEQHIQVQRFLDRYEDIILSIAEAEKYEFFTEDDFESEVHSEIDLAMNELAADLRHDATYYDVDCDGSTLSDSFYLEMDRKYEEYHKFYLNMIKNRKRLVNNLPELREEKLTLETDCKKITGVSYRKLKKLAKNGEVEPFVFIEIENMELTNKKIFKGAY